MDIIITKQSGHAIEISKTLDLTMYHYLVCIGGDGILSEVLQGFMKRKDWQNAIRFPIGIIPSGSGNGIAKSLLDAVNEIYSPENNAYLIVKGSPQPIDISSVCSENNPTTYSILGLSWGFIADVDFDSEYLRFLGSLRFTIAAIIKILKMKQWNGILKYLDSSMDRNENSMYWDSLDHLNDDISSNINVLNEKNKNWKIIQGNFSLFWATSMTHPSWDINLSPNSKLNDGYIYLIIVHGNVSIMTMFRILLGLKHGTHLQIPQLEIIKTRAFQLSIDKNDILAVDGERFKTNQVGIQVHRGLGRIMTIPSSIP